MTDGQLTVDRQPLVHSPLVFHRTADGDVFIAVTPIFWQALENPLRSLRNHEEVQVAASVNHQPGFFAPLVSFLDEEVRREASPHQCTRRYFPVPAAVTTDGKIEAGGLGHDVGVLLKLRIAPKHIAVLAALALLVASVPQVPHLIHAF